MYIYRKEIKTNNWLANVFPNITFQKYPLNDKQIFLSKIFRRRKKDSH